MCIFACPRNRVRHRPQCRCQGRSLLYIAAFQASRSSPRFKAYRRNLTDKGKATKTAIIATAPKLLTCLNAMLATNSDYNETAA